MRADSLPRRVIAIVSRRAPAFQPLPGERSTLAWAVRAALAHEPERRNVATRVASGHGPRPGLSTDRAHVVDPPDPSAEPVVTVEPWRWRQARPASVSAARARSFGPLSSLVGLVAAGLLAAAGFALTTLAPGESAAPAGPPPSPTATTGPAQTVQQYFDAINREDYRTAWALGGRNLGATYDDFAAGFAGTAHDSVTILSVTGDVVAVRLTSQATDGTTRHFRGSYTVHGGEIQAGSVRAD